MKLLPLLVSFGLFTAAFAADAPAWSIFPKATHVPAEYNDGDSFAVRISGTNHVVRLYFVDCPETAAENETDQRRVREQRRYFGIEDAKDLTAWGRKAKTRTAELLAHPFAVQTVFASAQGRSGKPRIYARILLVDGRDLAEILVQEGLARAKGSVRTLPDGTSGADHLESLKDLELVSARLNKGCWSAGKPERLAALRQEQRKERNELSKEKGDPDELELREQPLDLNTCSEEDLQRIPGIGAITAETIVKARPFKSLDELDRVDGVGKARIKQWAPFLIVGEKAK